MSEMLICGPEPQAYPFHRYRVEIFYSHPTHRATREADTLGCSYQAIDLTRFWPSA